MKYLFPICIGLLMCVGVVSTPSVEAQEITSNLQGTAAITLNPPFPEPGDEVTLSLKSSSFDIHQSDITWYINGEERQRGVGSGEYVMRAGPLGSQTRVEAVVIAPTGAGTREETIVRPVEVDLLWQAPSYVPPFYKGKALRPPQGDYHVVVNPNILDNSGVFIPKENLVYTWKYNGRVRGSKSGYGQYIFNGEPATVSHTISVEVETRQGDPVASRSVRIPAIDPAIVAYEHHPLYGTLFNRELPDEVNLLREEMVVAAHPFYFTETDITSDLLEYVWKINRNEVSGSAEFPHMITLRYDGAGGAARVSVEIEHTENFFQSAEEWRLFLLPDPEGNSNAETQ